MNPGEELERKLEAAGEELVRLNLDRGLYGDAKRSVVERRVTTKPAFAKSSVRMQASRSHSRPCATPLEQTWIALGAFLLAGISLLVSLRNG
jgi:hypothetical protein